MNGRRAEPHGTFVRRTWLPRRDGPGGGRRTRRGFSYDAFVPATIADADFVLLASSAELAARAERACRDLDGDAGRLPMFEPLARQLLRAESVASSRIEGLVLSYRRLATAAYEGEGRDQTAASVLANIRAVEEAVHLAARATSVTSDLLIEVHRKLFLGTRDEHLAGVIRQEQNWIGGASNSPRGADFVPPPEDVVPELLDDLCAFCDRDDIQPVVQAGIAHAQFETIHPFIDGNGRVGRALIQVVLRRRGVARNYLPPVSLCLAGRSDRYVRGLSDFRFGEQDAWYTTFADAVERAAAGAAELMQHVEVLKERWRRAAGGPRSDSAASKLIDVLAGVPILDVRTAQELLGVSDEAARIAIQRLEEAGVLLPMKTDKRSRAWECVGLFALLDAFERSMAEPARAPRRTSGRGPSVR